MKRRQFLTMSLVAGTSLVGGCSGAESPTTSLGEGDESPSPTSVENPRRQVLLIESDDVTDHELSVEVTLLSNQVDATSPAAIEVRTTNTGPQRRLKIESDPDCCLFNRQYQGSDPQGVYLYHRNETPEERKQNRWEETPDESGFGDYECGTPLYQQGDSVANEYEIWDDYRISGYYPTGTYRFEAPIEIHEGDEPGDSELLDEVTWGFSINVTMDE